MRVGQAAVTAIPFLAVTSIAADVDWAGWVPMEAYPMDELRQVPYGKWEADQVDLVPLADMQGVGESCMTWDLEGKGLKQYAVENWQSYVPPKEEIEAIYGRTIAGFLGDFILDDDTPPHLSFDDDVVPISQGFIEYTNYLMDISRMYESYGCMDTPTGLRSAVFGLENDRRFQHFSTGNPWIVALAIWKPEFDPGAIEGTRVRKAYVSWDYFGESIPSQNNAHRYFEFKVFPIRQYPSEWQETYDRTYTHYEKSENQFYHCEYAAGSTPEGENLTNPLGMTHGPGIGSVSYVAVRYYYNCTPYDEQVGTLHVSYLLVGNDNMEVEKVIYETDWHYRIADGGYTYTPEEIALLDGTSYRYLDIWEGEKECEFTPPEDGQDLPDPCPTELILYYQRNLTPNEQTSRFHMRFYEDENTSNTESQWTISPPYTWFRVMDSLDRRFDIEVPYRIEAPRRPVEEGEEPGDVMGVYYAELALIAYADVPDYKDPVEPRRVDDTNIALLETTRQYGDQVVNMQYKQLGPYFKIDVVCKARFSETVTETLDQFELVVPWSLGSAPTAGSLFTPEPILTLSDREFHYDPLAENNASAEAFMKIPIDEEYLLANGWLEPRRTLTLYYTRQSIELNLTVNIVAEIDGVIDEGNVLRSQTFHYGEGDSWTIEAASYVDQEGLDIQSNGDENSFVPPTNSYYYHRSVTSVPLGGTVGSTTSVDGLLMGDQSITFVYKPFKYDFAINILSMGRSAMGTNLTMGRYITNISGGIWGSEVGTAATLGIESEVIFNGRRFAVSVDGLESLAGQWTGLEVGMTSTTAPSELTFRPNIEDCKYVEVTNNTYVDVNGETISESYPQCVLTWEIPYDVDVYRNRLHIQYVSHDGLLLETFPVETYYESEQWRLVPPQSILVEGDMSYVYASMFERSDVAITGSESRTAKKSYRRQSDDGDKSSQDATYVEDVVTSDLDVFINFIFVQGEPVANITVRFQTMEEEKEMIEPYLYTYLRGEEYDLGSLLNLYIGRVVKFEEGVPWGDVTNPDLQSGPKDNQVLITGTYQVVEIINAELLSGVVTRPLTAVITVVWKENTGEGITIRLNTIGGGISHIESSGVGLGVEDHLRDYILSSEEFHFTIGSEYIITIPALVTNEVDERQWLYRNEYVSFCSEFTSSRTVKADIKPSITGASASAKLLRAIRPLANLACEFPLEGFVDLATPDTVDLYAFYVPAVKPGLTFVLHTQAIFPTSQTIVEVDDLKTVWHYLWLFETTFEESITGNINGQQRSLMYHGYILRSEDVSAPDYSSFDDVLENTNPLRSFGIASNTDTIIHVDAYYSVEEFDKEITLVGYTRNPSIATGASDVPNREEVSSIELFRKSMTFHEGMFWRLNPTEYDGEYAMDDTMDTFRYFGVHMGPLTGTVGDNVALTIYAEYISEVNISFVNVRTVVSFSAGSQLDAEQPLLPERTITFVESEMVDAMARLSRWDAIHDFMYFEFTPSDTTEAGRSVLSNASHSPISGIRSVIEVIQSGILTLHYHRNWNVTISVTSTCEDSSFESRIVTAVNHFEWEPSMTADVDNTVCVLTHWELSSDDGTVKITSDTEGQTLGGISTELRSTESLNLKIQYRKRYVHNVTLISRLVDEELSNEGKDDAGEYEIVSSSTHTFYECHNTYIDRDDESTSCSDYSIEPLHRLTIGDHPLQYRVMFERCLENCDRMNGTVTQNENITIDLLYRRTVMIVEYEAIIDATETLITKYEELRFPLGSLYNITPEEYLVVDPSHGGVTDVIHREYPTYFYKSFDCSFVADDALETSDPTISQQCRLSGVATDGGRMKITLRYTEELENVTAAYISYYTGDSTLLTTRLAIFQEGVWFNLDTETYRPTYLSSEGTRVSEFVSQYVYMSRFTITGNGNSSSGQAVPGNIIDVDFFYRPAGHRIIDIECVDVSTLDVLLQRTLVFREGDSYSVNHSLISSLVDESGAFVDPAYDPSVAERLSTLEKSIKSGITVGGTNTVKSLIDNSLPLRSLLGPLVSKSDNEIDMAVRSLILNTVNTSEKSSKTGYTKTGSSGHSGNDKPQTNREDELIQYYYINSVGDVVYIEGTVGNEIVRPRLIAYYWDGTSPLHASLSESQIQWEDNDFENNLDHPCVINPDHLVCNMNQTPEEPADGTNVGLVIGASMGGLSLLAMGGGGGYYMYKKKSMTAF